MKVDKIWVVIIKTILVSRIINSCTYNYSHCEPEGRGNLISKDCEACSEAFLMRLLRRSAPRNDS